MVNSGAATPARRNRDSQTEGLWDGDDTNGVYGFADRAGGHAGPLQPGVAYANLACGADASRDVLDDQLPAALAMEPD